MRILLALSVCMVAAAPAFAQSPGGPAPHEHATDAPRMGTYELEIRTDAGTMIGELSLAKSGELIEAALSAGPNKPQIKSFVRDGEQYVLTAGHGNLAVVYHLTFQRDSVWGSFTLVNGDAGMDGRVAGALRK